MNTTRTGILLRRRRPSCSRGYYNYFCLALPLLRLCLSSNYHKHTLGHRLIGSGAAGIGIHGCEAFSSVSTSSRRRHHLARRSYLEPNPSPFPTTTTPCLWLPTVTAPTLRMARPSSTLRGKTGASSVEEDLPEASSPPAKKSSPRKRSRPTKPTKDWSSLKVVELKEELKNRGLSTVGKKADLVSLLEQDDQATSKRTRKSSPKKKTTTPTAKEPPASPPRKRNTKAASPKRKTAASPKRKPSPPRKAADHQRITDIDELPKLWNEDMAKAKGSYTFKIASWNVAGLRAVVRKEPTALAKLCQKHDLDMLCLQETKLQEMHLEDPKLKLKGLLDEAGYDEHWSCSTAKKGYSGTCVFVKRRGTASKGKQQASINSFFAPKKKSDKTKKKSSSSSSSSQDKSMPVSPELLTPTNVGFSVGKEIDNEGRVVVLEFPWATIANVYVPNSGQKLERLDYRTKEWDKFFLKFMQDKQKKRGLPVIWLGDLNIAHRAYDIWNDGAKHLAKQAGVTEQERESFTQQLEAGFVDVFRRLHPDAKGNYSYWSQRAGNRAPNKGLRLDYFVASEDMFSEDSKVIPRDSYMIMDQLGSDHAPVVLELEIKGSTE